MKYFLISLMLVNISVLTACSSPPVKDQNSYLYSVPVGSKLRLNKAITIPENLARRYFQYGKLMKQKVINIYYPHCSILMNTLVDYERTIKPTVFEIYKVVDDIEEVRRYIYFAANFLTGSDGPTIVGFASYYYLRSTDDSDVRTLECIQWNDPFNVEYLSINEVKKSLGDYFTLQIND